MAEPGRPAIETHGLTKDFGAGRGVFDLDLVVEHGEVFGFLGPNGAGKTTTTRMLLDVIRPTRGTARILGLDSRADGVAARARVGYLPGDLHLHKDLTARQHLTWFSDLRGGAGLEAIEPLADRLDLDLDRPTRELSKGNRQKVGLVQAFFHQPDLLLLDEPTSGLDPLVQHEFHHLVRDATERGAAVFLSSHILDEVHHTADRVGIVRAGRLASVERIDEIEQRARRLVTVRFAEPIGAERFAGLPGVSDVIATGTEVRFAVDGPMDAVLAEVARHRAVDMLSEPAPLEDIFLSFYGEGPDDAPRPATDGTPDAPGAPR